VSCFREGKEISGKYKQKITTAREVNLNVVLR
jgi:hypothetical protein